ncbi:uncharacterized protein LOC118929691 [Manis pentadactyla]|uniref:uncharacterized protein LOC118929691 n=1 Tax=Manis pentadactyla TaxID=143292 RepID=UPI00255CC9A5|nr:uncharacterized protein LOC118929691 [Manis pentadactyla]
MFGFNKHSTAPSPPWHPMSRLLPRLLRRLITHLALEGPAAQAHPCSVRFSRWIFRAETGLGAIPPGCSASGTPGVLHGKCQGLRLKPPADSSGVSLDQTSRASACNEPPPGIHRGPQGQTLLPPICSSSAALGSRWQLHPVPVYVPSMEVTLMPLERHVQPIIQSCWLELQQIARTCLCPPPRGTSSPQGHHLVPSRFLPPNCPLLGSVTCFCLAARAIVSKIKSCQKLSINKVILKMKAIVKMCGGEPTGSSLPGPGPQPACWALLLPYTKTCLHFTCFRGLYA